MPCVSCGNYIFLRVSLLLELTDGVDEEDSDDHEGRKDHEDNLEVLLDLTTEVNGVKATLLETGCAVSMMMMVVVFRHISDFLFNTETQRTQSYFDASTSLCSLSLCGKILFKNVVKEGGHGDEDGGGGEPDGGGLTNTGVASLHLVRLHIDDIVLLEIVEGRREEVGIVEVDGVDLLVTLGIFTDELHILTDTVDSKVASLGEGLEDVDLLTGDLITTGATHFTED